MFINAYAWSILEDLILIPCDLFQKLYQPGSATKKTPLGSTQMKASTPVRYNLRSPIADNTFKTPSSRARLASSKKEEVRNRTLRSGGPRKVPFKF